jgi:2-methylcitrate dehydratase PrpD
MASKKTIAEELASFAIKQSEFPKAATREAKRIILDQLACQVMFAVSPWSIAYLDAVRTLGAGQGATVVYHGDPLSVDQAAFVNSAFGHGGEFDDTQLGSNTHSGAAIVPVALALAENRGLNGQQALEAVIVGVEIMTRVGAGAAPHLDERGFHAPPIVGPFGAAGAACRLLDTDEVTCVNAMGIAGSHSSGTREYTRSGGTMKRIHCAIPAMSGLRSAVMASHGITGPRTIIDGDRGILHCFAGEYDLAKVTNGLGTDYLMIETAYKPITSPWPAHAPLEGFGFLIDQNGLKPEDIAAIEVGTSSQAMKNIQTIKAPRDIMDAQYSLVYGLAVRLFRGGNKFRDYREEDLNDPRFLDFSRRVIIKVDPICDEERLRLNNRSAVVTVITTDGRRLEERVQFSKGHPKNPITDDELNTKFMDATEPLLGAQKAKQIAEGVWNIEQVKDASSLIKLCVRDGVRKSQGAGRQPEDHPWA